MEASPELATKEGVSTAGAEETEQENGTRTIHESTAETPAEKSKTLPAIEAEEEGEQEMEPSPVDEQLDRAEDITKDGISTSAIDTTPPAKDQGASQGPDQDSEEASKEVTSEESVHIPAKEAQAVEETPAGENGPGLEKQLSLRLYIPKQGEEATEELPTPTISRGHPYSGPTTPRGPAYSGPTTPRGPPYSGPTTPRGTPLMQRVQQLEQKLAQLEGKQSPISEIASTGNSTPRSNFDRPFRHSTRYVLEETEMKGTLLDRVAVLEQKLAYITLRPPSPKNDQLTPPIPPMGKGLDSKVDSQRAEGQTREWSAPTKEGEKAPVKMDAKETSKVTVDPGKVNIDGNPPEHLGRKEAAAAPAGANSTKENKNKSKSGIGKFTGLFAGCFSNSSINKGQIT